MTDAEDIGDDFHALERYLRARYSRGEYEVGLAAALDGTRKFPEQAVITTLWVARLQARIGDHALAIGTLAAGLGSGLWWAERALTASPDLAPLQGRQAFDSVLTECGERRRSAEAAAVPKVLLLQPGRPRPATDLLVALHGRGRGGRRFANHWQSVLDKGVAIAALQSGQLLAQGLYSWGDEAHARAQVTALYRRLLDSRLVRPHRVVFGGFGEGGLLATRLALQGVPVRPHGFIAIAPSYIDVPQWDPLADISRTECSVPITGYIYLYDAEPHLSRAREVAARLDEAGVDVRLTTELGLVGGFPEGFASRLDAAIDSILPADPPVDGHQIPSS